VKDGRAVTLYLWHQAALIAAFGWAEDVAARRRPQLWPRTRPLSTGTADRSGEAATDSADGKSTTVLTSPPSGR